VCFEECLGRGGGLGPLAATAGPEAVLAFGAPQPTAAALLLLRGGCGGGFLLPLLANFRSGAGCRGTAGYRQSPAATIVLLLLPPPSPFLSSPSFCFCIM